MAGCLWREQEISCEAGVRPVYLRRLVLRASSSLLALTFPFAFAATAFADTIAWVGSSTDDWFSLGSWEGHYRVPGVNDSVGINRPGPTIAAGLEAAFSELKIAATMDGSLAVEGALKTDYVQLGYEYPVNGTLEFMGGAWVNSRDIFVGSVGTGRLNLSGGSARSDGKIQIGGSGSALNLDNSSTFTNSGEVFVSYLDYDFANSINISGASSFTSGGLTVADGLDSIGIVSVKGAGSSLTVSHAMAIGSSGNGHLKIEGGGIVKSLGTTIIGNLGNAIGNLIITGSDSALETTGILTVGNEGDASMSIAAAASVNSGTVVIGRQAFGEVVVSGADTLWETGDLDLGGDTTNSGGPAGRGSIRVETGGVVESASAMLGMSAASTGEVLVDGGGSTWTVGSGGLQVGVNGRGRVTVQNSGRVDLAQTIIGLNSGSDGTVTVSGADSRLSTRDIQVGRQGDATLNITAGGTITAKNTYVGSEAGDALVQVEGSDSILTLAETFVVGNATGTKGNVSVETGARIQSKILSLGHVTGSSGALTLTGAGSAVSVSADSSVAGSGTMFVGWEGTANLAVYNAGSLEADRLNVGRGSGSLGNVYVSGLGSKINVANSLVIGGDGRGSVQVASGGSLAATTIFIAFSADSTGVLTIGAPSGQTAISAGNVSATNVDFGAGNGSIVLNHSETGYTLAAGITGPGRVIAESGVTTLSGYNSYSGGTTVSSGTLKGTATSFGSGGITNNSELVIDGSGTLNNTITGSGTVEKTGNGDVFLAGDNSYSGNTKISAGALVGSGKSFGSGEIINNATLFVNGPGTLANKVSGTGAVAKVGSGNMILTGNSTYSGATDVFSGKLSVNGTIASNVFVYNGATLGGSGTIGALSVASGGTLSPGNSIGTLTASGDVTFASGSTYAVEIDAAGNSDRLAVNGAITIGNNVDLVVTTLSSHSAYNIGTQYEILTAAGGIAGAFSRVNDNFAYLTVAVSKSSDSGAAYISFSRTSPDPGLLASGASPEAAGAANAVETLGETSPLYDAALFLRQGETQSAFSQLAGEMHPSLAMALINRSQLTRDVILDRLRNAFNGVDARSILPDVVGAGASDPKNIDEASPAFWSSGFGSRGRFEGNDLSVDMKGGGVLFGLDGDWGNGWRAGVAAGYGRDAISQTSSSAAADVDSYYLATYAGGTMGPASLRLGVIHAFQNVETHRAVSFSTLQENLIAGYDGSTTQVFAEAAWRFDFDLNQFEPYANISYVNMRTDAFSERGGVAAVSSGSASRDQLYTTLGARFSRALAFEDVTGRALLDIGWRHAYGDPTAESTLFYAGGSGFSVASAPMAQDVALISLGLRYDLNPSATLTFRYGALFGAGVVDQSASVELGVRF